jgi:hypothetical protein
MKLKLSILIAVLCFIAYLGWFVGRPWYYRRQVDRLIDAYHARSEPILPSDFQRPQLADVDNIATYLRRAADNLHLTEQQEKLFFKVRGSILPLEPQEVQILAQELATNASSLADIREAQKHPAVDWGDERFDPDPTKRVLRYLNQMRELMDFLHDLTLYHHQLANDAEAIRCIRDILFIADVTDQQTTYISHLVALGIRANGTDLITQIAVDLNASERPSVAPLIARLLNNADRQPSLRRCWEGERTQTLAQFQYFGNKSLGSAPIFLSAIPPILNTCDLVEAACVAPDYPTAMSVMKNFPDDRGMSALAAIFVGALRKAPETEFRETAEERMAAIALAIRLYVLDNGHRPASLQKLVPNHLPQIPLDPFTRSRPLSYDSSKAVLYSVFKDGVDDGGMAERESDLVIPLDRPPRQKLEADE